MATIGDAPNEEGLFVRGRFDLSVGTAEVLAQREAFAELPEFVSQQREVDGFLELAELLLRARRSAQG